MIALLPHITLAPFDLGPVPVSPFDMLVAAGVLVGAWRARARAELLGLELDRLRSLCGWCVAAGFVMAHVFDVLLYQPGALAQDPLLLLRLWAGISSYGGLLGGALGFLWATRSSGESRLLWLDTLMCGVVPAWLLGRAGCALVHDHVGIASDSPLAVAFPGGARHDLGVLEFLYLGLVVAPVVTVLARRSVRSGTIGGVVALLYGPVRFALEFLRMPDTDPRYAGLTPAQYLAVPTAIAGALLLWRARRSASLPAAGPERGDGAGGGTASGVGDGGARPGDD
jgi:phosphatidylglycerol:prolipoprotein diacylglycerol transferase